MKKNKILIIIISIFLILVTAGGVLAYLYINTDVFKSEQELFGKYFTQELETYKRMIDLKTIEVYQNMRNEDKYESDINVKVVHSEGGEISNPLNNLSLKVDMQKDDEQQYLYAKGQILFKEEQVIEEQTVFEDKEYLQAEIIKEKEQYGIRFADAVKQFVTIKKDNNIQSIANEIGIESSLLEKIINILDGAESLIVEEEINETKSKYVDLISDEISKGIFGKQKNAIITYNGAIVETNAYSVSLTSEQVRNIFTQISTDLEDVYEIPEDQEMPTVKITVYEQNEVTIRTVMEVDQNRIVIEAAEQNGEITANISYLDLASDEQNEYKFKIIKTNAENQEKIEIILSAWQGEEEYTISLLSDMQIVNNNIEYDFKISHQQAITVLELIIENEIKINNEFEKMQKLEQGNYVSLSDIKDETRRKQLIDLLKEVIPQKTMERVVLLMGKFNTINEETENIEQVENEVTVNSEI